MKTNAIHFLCERGTSAADHRAAELTLAMVLQKPPGTDTSPPVAVRAGLSLP